MRQAVPRLSGRVCSSAYHVPTAAVCAADITLRLKSPTPLPKLLGALERAAAGRLASVLGVSAQPLVSADHAAERRSCVLDAEACLALPAGAEPGGGARTLKLVCWYDEPTASAHRALDLAAAAHTAARTPFAVLMRSASALGAAGAKQPAARA